MRNKWRIIAFIIICVWLCLPGTVFAEDIPVTMDVNGQEVEMDTLGFIENGRTMMPIRFLTQALGVADIEWDPDQNIALVHLAEDMLLTLVAGDNRALINEEEFLFSREIPVIDGRMFVPISEMKALLDFSIAYHARDVHISIEKEGFLLNPSMYAEPKDREEWLWLARIVEVEARGLPMENKIAVANVVLNRVRDMRFPSTVFDVIFDVDVHQQFPPAHKVGFSEILPSDDSYRGAKAALYGVNNIDNCLFFNNRPFAGLSDRLYKVMNGEYFYY